MPDRPGWSERRGRGSWWQQIDGVVEAFIQLLASAMTAAAGLEDFPEP